MNPNIPEHIQISDVVAALKDIPRPVEVLELPLEPPVENAMMNAMKD